jgi:cytoskeleton protein RodZ
MTAGALLRRGREAAGLSLDAVAQQLKLAPRQVTALEENDFARLPGRTFVRGFVRNYARLVRVDAATVLAALDGSEAPALDTPPLHPTAPTMGELPTHENSKPGWARWAIPLTLVAIIAGAAIYEFSRAPGEAPRLPGLSKGEGAAETAAPPAASPAPAATATPPVNPIATPPAGSPPTGTAPPGSASAADGAGDRAAGPLPNPAPSAPSPTATVSAAPAGLAAPAATAAPAAAITAAPAATLVIAARGKSKSWAEVRDGSGRILLSQTLAAGQSASVSGTPPLAVVIGNANDASVEFRGQAVDLAPHIQKNIARFQLQ